MNETNRDDLQPDRAGKSVRAASAGLLAILLCAQGCIVIPTPEHRPGFWDNAPTTARRNVSKDSAQKIIPGQSRVEDVLLALGEPDAASADGHRIAYHWEMVTG